MSEKKYVDTLVWKLKEKGHQVHPDVAKSINDIGYKLLEQVRLGNRDNVFYLLLRCFKAKEKKFPNELVEAFKPENREYFKTLIFSFLAPILGEEKSKPEGGES
jgi:CRISPR-associated protein Cst1